MRASSLSLAFVCSSLVVGFGSTGRAQQGTFALTACNQSGEPQILLSIAHRVGVNDNRFVLRGWFPLTQGCSQAPGIPKGNFYYFALVPKEGGKYWGGNTNICVNLKQSSYQRILTQNYTCKPGDEAIVPFAEVKVTMDAITLPFK